MSTTLEAFMYGALVSAAGCSLVVAFFSATHMKDEDYEGASVLAIAFLTCVGICATGFLTYLML